MADGKTIGSLRGLFDEKHEGIFITILDWKYSVSASLSKHPPWVVFQWEGITTTISKKKTPVIGEFIISDDRMQQEWEGHPFEAGEVRLISGETDADNFISVDIRVNDKCCEAVWKGFVLGQGSDGGIAIRVKIDSPSEDDFKRLQGDERYKDPKCIMAVRRFSVVSGGKFRDSGETAQ